LFAGVMTLAAGGACRADEYYVLSQAHSAMSFDVDVVISSGCFEASATRTTPVRLLGGGFVQAVGE